MSAMATETGTNPGPDAGAAPEPRLRVGAGWVARFSLAWLGIWTAQLTTVQLLLPLQMEELFAGESADDGWTDGVLSFGALSGAAGLLSLLAYPLAGALSDRTDSRLGRRRPWILAGTALFAASLGLLGSASRMWAVTALWCAASVGFCMMTAALTATLSDQVPVRQRGFVSGMMSAPQPVGTILGLLLATTLFAGQAAGYLAMAAALTVCVLPLLTRPEGPEPPPGDHRPFRLRESIAGLWVSPRRHPDFGWTLLSRVLVNLGNALGTTLLLYFLLHGLHRADAEGDLIVLTLLYMVFVVTAGIGLGLLSDRMGRRKPFVVAAALFQALAAAALAVFPDFTVALVSAGLLGLGYGCFLAVDQALATQVLPNAADRGKDLGIMNIATAVPQAVGATLGALVVAAGGFSALFLVAAAAATLGAATVLPVKGAR